MSHHFNSMDEIRATNSNAGQHFFDEDTLVFFNSNIHREVYDGRYFITSEKGPDNVRLFSVRRANEDGTITTMGGFQRHGTHQDAEWAIRDRSWEENGT